MTTCQSHLIRYTSYDNLGPPTAFSAALPLIVLPDTKTSSYAFISGSAHYYWLHPTSARMKALQVQCLLGQEKVGPCDSAAVCSVSSYISLVFSCSCNACLSYRDPSFSFKYASCMCISASPFQFQELFSVHVSWDIFLAYYNRIFASEF